MSTQKEEKLINMVKRESTFSRNKQEEERFRELRSSRTRNFGNAKTLRFRRPN